MYYSRNQEDSEFDNGIREIMLQGATDVEFALYVQNQEILSLLRQVLDIADNKVHDTYDLPTTITNIANKQEKVTLGE